MKKTKIVCTIGPACSSVDIIKKMILAGMNVARFNFSHGEHADHKKMMDAVKQARAELGIPVAIMLDTKGPEYRIGRFRNGKVTLAEGDSFTFTSEDILGDEHRVSVSYKNLPAELEVGSRILLANGLLEFRVTGIHGSEIDTVVENGGELTDRKSMSFPGKVLNQVFLSEQDKSDLLFGIENDVDFVALSFVSNKENVEDVRRFLHENGGDEIDIIAKIENRSGVDNIVEIIDAGDGIMVARGDMGVEVEFERLPGLQKRFIRKCYQSGKMVITATQMLESMIHSTTPTRAEITDVANAVFDGTSAVMLSAETAAGDHPALVVRVMSRIAEQAEEDAFEMQVYRGIPYDIDTSDVTNAICDAAVTTARDVHAKAIIAVTTSGLTARRVSKFRPLQTIVAATPSVKTFHQLSLSWGVEPVLALNQEDTEHLFVHAVDCAKQMDLVTAGDTVVITAGVPLKQTGTTNLLKVQVVQ